MVKSVPKNRPWLPRISETPITTMVSSKKSSTETKSKQAGTSKPGTKTKNQNNSRKSDKDDGKRKKKKNNSTKKLAINGNGKEVHASLVSVSGSESGEDDAKEDRAETTSKKANSSKSKKIKRNHGKQDENGHEEEEEEQKIHKFPMHRIKKIMRDEDSDLRINQEALFLVNKASEMFLVQFCKDAYACCAQDRKKSLAYKHLSSVVCKRKRYDFLSDFVPEKLKLEDALRETDMADTGRGKAS